MDLLDQSPKVCYNEFLLYFVVSGSWPLLYAVYFCEFVYATIFFCKIQL